MNKPLRRVALAMMAMVVLLMANVTFKQVIQADDYNNDERNNRSLYAEYSQQRGQITAGGQSLANSSETGQEPLEYARNYPGGSAFAPVTGFYSFIYGSNGIERGQSDILNGTDDSMAFNRLSDTVTGQEPRGGNVELTVNPDMQRTAYEQLTSKGYQGSVVALNPQNGQILAMANAPSYDPAKVSTNDRNAAVDAWQNYENDPDGPMVNRAVDETYPPGSSFKLITTAAALENGYTPDSQVQDAAEITPPGTSVPLPNYGNRQCQGDTLTAALEYSCNTAYAEIAGDVGADTMRKKAAAFGFGEDLNVPMNVAESNMGEMADPAALYQSGIGQRDVRVTPLQNAMMAAAVANDGEVMKPQLVQSTKAPDMSEIDGFQPEKLSQATSPEVAHQIRDMMVKSEENTSGSGKISGVQIASKTGTAQHGAEADPHGWYVAFAPSENPQIAVAVIVENGGDEGAEATGGSIAAPVGREVIRAGLQGGG